MTPRLTDTRSWVRQGSALFADVLAGLDEAAFDGATPLSGWSRRHLVAHVAANAEALGNLVHWAATGERTPMYDSPAQRAADIDAGSRLSGPELVSWFERSQAALDDSMNALTDRQWAAEVVTAHGRTVTAEAVPWLRARELLVHSVDLDAGVSYADLPAAFLAALLANAAAKRSAADDGPALELHPHGERSSVLVAGRGTPERLTGSLADLCGYLTGRPGDITTASGAPPPELPAWL